MLLDWCARSTWILNSPRYTWSWKARRLAWTLWKGRQSQTLWQNIVIFYLVCVSDSNKAFHNGKESARHVPPNLQRNPAFTKLICSNLRSNPFYSFFKFLRQFIKFFISIQLMRSLQCAFNNWKRVFYRVEVWRVWRKKFEFTSFSFDERMDRL